MATTDAPASDGAVLAGGAREVTALLAQARALVRAGGHHDLDDRLAQEHRKMERPVCNVLVLGEFKKGKSSLVNALLNARVCPVDADLTTGVPLLVRHGPTPAAWLVEAVPDGDGADDDGDGLGDEDDDAGQQARPVPLAELSRVALDRSTPALAGLRAMHVELPRAMLRRGIVLIDTPGVHGGLHDAEAAATLRALSLADAFVFVTDASQEYSGPELEFLHRAVEECPTAICVMTKTDFYPQWRTIARLNQGHLQRAGLAQELIPLATPLRHHAMRRGDSELDAASGYPRLGVRLREVLAGGKEVLAARSAASAVRTSIGQVERALEAEHAGLADPARTSELLARLEEAKRRAEQLRGGAARWQQHLNDRFADATAAVDLDLATRLRGIRRDAGEAIASGDPAAIWKDVESWMYRRTNDEMLAHHNEIKAETEAVAADVAQRFELDAEETEAFRMDRSADMSAFTAQLGAPKFEQLSLRELGFIAVRGSTTSMVICGMVAQFVAFTVPILTPAAAIMAATLGRKAVKGARESEVRSRRAEASRAVQQYLEETELAARKASKDLLRHTNQSLRNYFVQRAEELNVSAGRNLEAVARSIKLDRDEAQTRLAQVKAELQQAAALRAAADEVLAHLGPGLAAP